MSTYIKNDSELGFVQDNAEIEYLKFNNMRHSVFGCMLGDFNSKGKYVVQPEIVKELIAMKKYMVDTVENIDICNSALKLDKQITFFVTYAGECAILSLVEKVNYQANFKLNKGSYSDIIEFELDRVKTSGEVNKAALYKRWNIDEIPGQVLDVFNMDEATLAAYFNLLGRFKYLMKANELLLNTEENIEQVEIVYCSEMLNVLTHYPKLNDQVKKDMKEFFDDKKEFIRSDKPNFAKTVNELVYKSIENNIHILEEQEKNEFLAERHNALNIYNTEIREVVPVENNQKFINDELVEYRSVKTEQTNKSAYELAVAFVTAQNNLNEKFQQMEIAENKRKLINTLSDYGFEETKQEKVEETKQEKETLNTNLVQRTAEKVAGASSDKKNTKDSAKKDAKKASSGKKSENSAKKATAKKGEKTTVHGSFGASTTDFVNGNDSVKAEYNVELANSILKTSSSEKTETKPNSQVENSRQQVNSHTRLTAEQLREALNGTSNAKVEPVVEEAKKNDVTVSKLSAEEVAKLNENTERKYQEELVY